MFIHSLPDYYNILLYKKRDKREIKEIKEIPKLLKTLDCNMLKKLNLSFEPEIL